jgi:hypothetical protein
MKQVFASIIFNFIIIIMFSIIYIYLKDEFIYNVSDKLKTNNRIQIIDLIMYTTTIQSGVGLTNIMPNSVLSKLVTMTQQYIMIGSYLFILYFFILHT